MNSDPNTVDYSVVLADLEAKKAQIENAINVIRSLQGAGLSAPSITGIEAQTPRSTAANNLSSGIARDTFFGLSIPDAAKKFLGMKKGAATTAEIIDAMRMGGQASATSEGFAVTATSGLYRAYKQGAGIVKVGRGMWGLADWYPNKPRKPPESSGAG